MMKMLDVLVLEKKLSPALVGILQRYQEKWHKSEYQALVDCNIFSEGSFADTMAELLQMDRVYKIEGQPLSFEITNILSYEMAKENEIFPLRFLPPGHIEVAIYDPSQKEKYLKLFAAKKLEVNFVLSERQEICRAITEYYPVSE